MGETESEEVWSRETVPKVMKIITSRLRLPQPDIISLLLVSSSLNRTLLTSPSLWLVLDFHEMNNAGDRLIAALSLDIRVRLVHITKMCLVGHLYLAKWSGQDGFGSECAALKSDIFGSGQVRTALKKWIQFKRIIFILNAQTFPTHHPLKHLLDTHYPFMIIVLSNG
ncbi:hypothetical protein HanOQP8_Chr10g0358591 [Helianthus annuus]|nr:hypothetical protein HanOQP8_Chr10g0358591 [Helianthus annuus]